MRKDKHFRMKMRPKYLYSMAWAACAKLYGIKCAGLELSEEGQEAFDDFCAGFQEGFKAGKKAGKK